MTAADYIASPAVVALAGRLGITVADVARDSGRTHIAREDVERFAGGDGAVQPTRGNATAPDMRFWDVDHAAFGPASEEPLSRFAAAAAENLSAANRMIPQVTHHDRADMREVEAFRGRLKREASSRGVRLTALAFHLKALALCLDAFPRFNASLSPDGKALILKHYCHIGIAVDTPHGLMVPVIRNVDHKGLWQIASELGDLAARAQERRIKTDEMGGASMSVSNLGGIGGIGFTPIVNPPEVAILGITRTELVPVWRDERWEAVPMTPLDLSYDHRVINGADAARFLVHFKQMLADPRRILV